jgi:CheY-like chemotaxis protein
MDDKRGILFVDDHPLILESVKYLPSLSMGREVFAASNAAAALDVYRQHNEYIDVIVSDYMMPGKDGIELFEMINEIAPMPVVFIIFTVRNSDEVVDGFMNTKPGNAVPWAVVSKCDDRDKLPAAIREGIIFIEAMRHKD